MKSKFIKILQVLVLAALLIPYPTTSVPEWKVKVINKGSESSAGLEIRQTWSHGQGETTDSMITDEQGFVTFPARKRFLPLIMRIPLRGLEYLENLLLHGASIGARAYVWSAYTNNRDWLRYYEGGKIHDTLVVDK